MTAPLGVLTDEQIEKLRAMYRADDSPVDTQASYVRDLLATIADRDAALSLALDTIERAWGALAPCDRGKSTLASVIAAQLAARDAALAEAHEHAHRLMGEIQRRRIEADAAESRAREQGEEIERLRADLREVHEWRREKAVRIAQLEALIPAAQAYAASNPIWYFGDKGEPVRQDPCGVHRALAALTPPAAVAAPDKHRPGICAEDCGCPLPEPSPEQATCETCGATPDRRAHYPGCMAEFRAMTAERDETRRELDAMTTCAEERRDRAKRAEAERDEARERARVLQRDLDEHKVDNVKLCQRVTELDAALRLARDHIDMHRNEQAGDVIDAALGETA